MEGYKTMTEDEYIKKYCGNSYHYYKVYTADWKWEYEQTAYCDIWTARDEYRKVEVVIKEYIGD